MKIFPPGLREFWKDWDLRRDLKIISSMLSQYYWANLQLLFILFFITLIQEENFLTEKSVEYNDNLLKKQWKAEQNNSKRVHFIIKLKLLLKKVPS